MLKNTNKEIKLTEEGKVLKFMEKAQDFKETSLKWELKKHRYRFL